jgi:hypothetical protein
LIRGPALAIVTLGIVIGLCLVLISTIAGAQIGETPEGESVRAALAIGGVVLLLIAGLFGARQLLLLDRFFAFKRERLRDIYVLERPNWLLVDTSRTIDEALYSRGPQFGVGYATELLEERELIDRYRARSPDGELPGHAA